MTSNFWVGKNYCQIAHHIVIVEVRTRKKSDRARLKNGQKILRHLWMAPNLSHLSKS